MDKWNFVYNGLIIFITIRNIIVFMLRTRWNSMVFKYSILAEVGNAESTYIFATLYHKLPSYFSMVFSINKWKLESFFEGKNLLFYKKVLKTINMGK